MELIRLKYKNKEAAIEQLPWDYFRSFYFRPDGEDRGWDSEYREFHRPYVEEFRELLLNLKVEPVEMVVLYSGKEGELTIIIEFKESIGIANEPIIERLVNFLKDDAGNTVAWGGVYMTRIVIMESF